MKQRSMILQARYESILQTRTMHPDIPIEKFCKDQGITPWTYYYWRKRLRKKVNPVSTGSTFIPLTVTPPRQQQQPSFTEKISCEIIFPSGCRVVTKDTLDTMGLTVLLRTVAGIPS